MKYNFPVILLLIAIGSCQPTDSCPSGDSNEIVVSVEVKNAPRDEKLELVRLNKDRARFTHAQFDGGKSSYKIKFEKRIEPEFVELHLFKKRVEILVLTGQCLTIKVDMNQPELFQVEGSPDTELFKRFVSVDESFQKEVETLNRDFSEGKLDNSAGILAFDALKTRATLQYKNLFKENMNSPVAVMVFESPFFNQDSEWEFLVKLADQVQQRFPSTELAAELQNLAQSAAQTGIGAVAPDITLTDVKGEQISLSAFKGKYVLVDFWASWCKPCRMENPNLVGVYQKYKGKNFEILGTSLDKDKQKWLDAIKSDKLSWPQGIDNEENSAGKTYRVQGIPHSVLVDPQGIIIAKNLRGQALHQKLEDIFKK